MNLSGIDKDLLLDFLCTFSRFEYALKRAGFAKGDDKYVESDWGKFGQQLRALSPSRLEQVLRAGQHIRQQPPMKQVKRDGRLGWSSAVDESQSEIELLLVYVRRVRNNLFHGGKYPDPDGPVEDGERDTSLLHDSRAVLIALLDLPSAEDLKRHFCGDQR